MIIKKLTIENIRSYNSQEIIFPEGSTLLSGDIGSGKTTILLAIEFALFGLQPGQKGTSLLRNSENEGKVILETEICGKDIVIERSLKRIKKSVSQDYASISIDGEKFEESVTEIKNKVLQQLNYPQEFSKKTNLLYKFTVYTPQEEMRQIILEPGDMRLNTLRHVFGIDKYKRIEENANLLTLRLREKIRFNEGVILDSDPLKQALEKRKENFTQIKKRKSFIENEINKIEQIKIEKEKELEGFLRKINEKKVLEYEISKSLIIISEKKQQAMTFNNNIKAIQQEISESKKIFLKEDELELLNKEINSYEKKLDELQKDYIDVIGRLNSEESRKREAMNSRNKISILKQCPTCLQEVSNEYKNNIIEKTEREINTNDINIESFNLKKRFLENSTSSLKKEIQTLKTKSSEIELQKIKMLAVKEKEQRINDIESQKKFIEKDLEILEKHLKTIEKSIDEYTKFEPIFEEKNKEMRELKLLENNYAIKNAEINKEIQFLQEEIKEKEKELEEKEIIRKETDKIKELEFWISKNFLDIILFTEKQVMLNLKDEFSKLFSKWFSILVSDSLTAKLDDNFSPVIEQQDYELDYSFLSGGERTAVALAYRLALNQVINSILSSINTTDLVILDEPTDGFSEQQLDKIRDVLNQLNIKQLILVSHEQKMESFVDNIIRFQKENNLTRIVS